MTDNPAQLLHDLDALNVDVVRMGGRPLVSMAAARAMIDVDQLANLRRSIIATASYLSDLAAAMTGA